MYNAGLRGEARQYESSSAAAACAALACDPTTPAAPVANPCAVEALVAGWNGPVAARCWWVLHTRARNEKAVAERLDRAGLSYYLPLVESQRTRRWRREACQIPLFPGYLFLLGEKRDCEVAWRTNRVANILAVGDQARLESELRQIQRLIASDEPVDLYPALRVGRAVRITRGALRGLEGVVVRRRDVCRVFLAVTFVGQSVVVEVDSDMVEPVDRSRP